MAQTIYWQTARVTACLQVALDGQITRTLPALHAEELSGLIGGIAIELGWTGRSCNWQCDGDFGHFTANGASGGEPSDQEERGEYAQCRVSSQTVSVFSAS